jgi:hypothetical protein
MRAMRRRTTLGANGGHPVWISSLSLTVGKRSVFHDHLEISERVLKCIPFSPEFNGPRNSCLPATARASPPTAHPPGTFAGPPGQGWSPPPPRQFGALHIRGATGGGGPRRHAGREAAGSVRGGRGDGRSGRAPGTCARRCRSTRCRRSTCGWSSSRSPPNGKVDRKALLNPSTSVDPGWPWRCRSPGPSGPAPRPTPPAGPWMCELRRIPSAFRQQPTSHRGAPRCAPARGAAPPGPARLATGTARGRDALDQGLPAAPAARAAAARRTAADPRPGPRTRSPAAPPGPRSPSPTGVWRMSDQQARP